MHKNYAARNLERLMRERGYTQLTLAKNAGISRAQISKWLNGHYGISANSLNTLCNVFDVSISELTAEPQEAPLDIGLNIKTARRAARLTQEEFAERIGVPDSSISAWERGTITPSEPDLEKLANAFEINVGQLTRGRLSLTDHQTGSHFEGGEEKIAADPIKNELLLIKRQLSDLTQMVQELLSREQ